MLTRQPDAKWRPTTMKAKMTMNNYKMEKMHRPDDLVQVFIDQINNKSWMVFLTHSIQSSVNIVFLLLDTGTITIKLSFPSMTTNLRDWCQVWWWKASQAWHQSLSLYKCPLTEKKFEGDCTVFIDRKNKVQWKLYQSPFAWCTFKKCLSISLLGLPNMQFISVIIYEMH